MLTITDVFLDQKRVNVCERMVNELLYPIAKKSDLQIYETYHFQTLPENTRGI
jgi:hypothetical protein